MEHMGSHNADLAVLAYNAEHRLGGILRQNHIRVDEHDVGRRYLEERKVCASSVADIPAFYDLHTGIGSRDRSGAVATSIVDDDNWCANVANSIKEALDDMRTVV